MTIISQSTDSEIQADDNKTVYDFFMDYDKTSDLVVEVDGVPLVNEIDYYIKKQKLAFLLDAPFSGQVITITRKTKLVQELSIRDKKEYKPGEIENAFDKLTMSMQELKNTPARDSSNTTLSLVDLTDIAVGGIVDKQKIVFKDNSFIPFVDTGLYYMKNIEDVNSTDKSSNALMFKEGTKYKFKSIDSEFLKLNGKMDDYAITDDRQIVTKKYINGPLGKVAATDIIKNRFVALTPDNKVAKIKVGKTTTKQTTDSLLGTSIGGRSELKSLGNDYFTCYENTGSVMKLFVVHINGSGVISKIAERQIFSVFGSARYHQVSSGKFFFTSLRDNVLRCRFAQVNSDYSITLFNEKKTAFTQVMDNGSSVINDDGTKFYWVNCYYKDHNPVIVRGLLNGDEVTTVVDSTKEIANAPVASCKISKTNTPGVYLVITSTHAFLVDDRQGSLQILPGVAIPHLRSIGADPVIRGDYFFYAYSDTGRISRIAIMKIVGTSLQLVETKDVAGYKHPISQTTLDDLYGGYAIIARGSHQDGSSSSKGLTYSVIVCHNNGTFTYTDTFTNGSVEDFKGSYFANAIDKGTGTILTIGVSTYLSYDFLSVAYPFNNLSYMVGVALNNASAGGDVAVATSGDIIDFPVGNDNSYYYIQENGTISKASTFNYVGNSLGNNKLKLNY